MNLNEGGITPDSLENNPKKMRGIDGQKAFSRKGLK
jgi:hypothetical protein